MAEIRFRVRGANEEWTANGPDLLRPRDNARLRAKAIMGAAVKGWSTRIVYNGGATAAPSNDMTKSDALDRFVTWAKNPVGATFVLMHGGETRVVVRLERVEILGLDNVSPATALIWSLLRHQFPNIQFGGGYVYKKILGTNDYSDHAWGTAIDATENPPEPFNDETTDWLSRMARSGCMAYDYVLGSRNGSVVQVAPPDYDLEPSGASTSHLWHNHISQTDHEGRKPPKTGGVW